MGILAAAQHSCSSCSSKLTLQRSSSDSCSRRISSAGDSLQQQHSMVLAQRVAATTLSPYTFCLFCVYLPVSSSARAASFRAAASRAAACLENITPTSNLSYFASHLSSSQRCCCHCLSSSSCSGGSRVQRRSCFSAAAAASSALMKQLFNTG